MNMSKSINLNEGSSMIGNVNISVAINLLISPRRSKNMNLCEYEQECGLFHTAAKLHFLSYAAFL